MRQRFRLLLATVALAAHGAAHSHAIWIERDGDGAARAYFGEFAEGVREKTGASLDKIATPLAWQGEGKRALALLRKADHIEIAASGAGDVLLSEAGFAPRDDKQHGGYMKAIFYAKAGRAELRPQLDLDLVPATASGKVFVLTLRGKSVPKAPLTLVGPLGWEKPLRSDEWGQVSLPALPWKGRYLIEVAHTEEAPGEAAGQKYQRLRHVLTASFVLAEGEAATAAR